MHSTSLSGHKDTHRAFWGVILNVNTTFFSLHKLQRAPLSLWLGLFTDSLLLHAKVSMVVLGDSMKNAATHPEDETVTAMFTTNITSSQTVASLNIRRHHIF